MHYAEAEVCLCGDEAMDLKLTAKVPAPPHRQGDRAFARPYQNAGKIKRVPRRPRGKWICRRARERCAESKCLRCATHERRQAVPRVKHNYEADLEAECGRDLTH